MSKGPSTFRIADFRRTVEALKSAGLKFRVEMTPGKVVFVPDDGDTGEAATAANEWDGAE